MKQITKEELNMLIENGVIKNSHRGLTDSRGYTIGYGRTRHKRYIEDKYADMAKAMIERRQ